MALKNKWGSKEKIPFPQLLQTEVWLMEGNKLPLGGKEVWYGKIEFFSNFIFLSFVFSEQFCERFTLIRCP